MIDVSKVGTKEWNDSAECGEWAFMAMMMREASALIPHTLSGLNVAISIADSRAKEGWRNVADREQENE
jgi:hypothetical protein